MRLSEIPVGHLAKISTGDSICYRGEYVYVWVNGTCLGLSNTVEEANSDYEDLGELNIDVQECMRYIVKATVG